MPTSSGSKLGVFSFVMPSFVNLLILLELGLYTKNRLFLLFECACYMTYILITNHINEIMQVISHIWFEDVECTCCLHLYIGILAQIDDTIGHTTLLYFGRWLSIRPWEQNPGLYIVVSSLQAWRMLSYRISTRRMFVYSFFVIIQTARRLSSSPMGRPHIPMIGNIT